MGLAAMLNFEFLNASNSIQDHPITFLSCLASEKKTSKKTVKNKWMKMILTKTEQDFI
jgi:hypothetical protein